MRFFHYLITLLTSISLMACGGGGGSAGTPSGATTPLSTSAPASLTMGIGAAQEYLISGGKGPYTVSSSNTQVAAASVTDANLAIRGVATGNSTIVVRDATGSTVSISVSVGNLVALYTTAPSSLTIAKDTQRVFNVGGGAPGYSVVSSDVRVATATVSGTQLIISGVSAGATTLEIRDTAGAVVTLSITVGGSSARGLYTSAPSVLTLVKDSVTTYEVGGGVPAYTVTSSDTRVASVTLTGNSMAVAATAFGSTTITVRDSAGTALSVSLTVAGSSTGALFTSAPSSLSMSAGTSFSYLIGGGTAPYSVASSDARVVTGSISGTSLTIAALKAGNAALRISDATGSTLQIVVVVDGTSAGASGPATIDIVASSSTLSSAAGSKVTFLVTVKDSVNTAIPNQSVTFTSSSGTLTGANPAPNTDANGSISTVSLSPGADLSNRTITVTATAGSVSKSISIPVVGTTVSISGAGSALVGNPAMAYSVKAADSGGKPIVGAVLSIASTLGNTVSPQTVTTDVAGAGTFNFTPTIAGTDTLRVSGLGASATATVAVSNEDFAFTAPVAGANLIVNTANTVTVRYRVGGVGVAGQTVTFSTTRGTLSASTAVTDASGNATVTVNSTTAGPVTLSAQLGTARSSVTAAFIATVPATIVLQANPGAVLPNAGGSTTNQSTLTATVRDATGNPVSGQVVNFTAVQDGSNGSIVPGSGTTDANGMTSVQFIPGALSTSANGVKLRATVQSAPAIFADATLTVSGNALFIAIGVGSTLTVLDSTTYQKDFSVYVTDANGAAAANRSVTVSVFPPTYGKGRLVWNAGAKTWEYDATSPTTCANEDTNRNGILDAGEDINTNGQLEPGLPVVVSPASFTTDANGYATFTMRFGKNYALWLSTQVTARALVSGTESSKTVAYNLEMTSADAKSESTPANVVSPFGTAAVCTNPL